MAQRVPLPSPAALLAALERALREVSSLRRSLDRAEERADALEQYLKSHIHAHSPAAATGAGLPAVRLPRRRPKDSQFLQELAAQRGIEKLDFAPLPSGAASARIDGGPVFCLSTKLAVLFETLARDPGRTPGELVDWKPRREVVADMEKKLGEPFKVHAIETQVTRLRKVLEHAGRANPYFVQSDKRLGWRLAVRRKPGV